MVQWLLFIYFFISICAILFNIASAFILRSRDRELHNYTMMYSFAVEQELLCIRSGAGVHKSHFRLLKRQLKSPEKLLSYDEALQPLYQEEPELVKSYLQRMFSVYERLAFTYLEADTTYAAFFLNFVNRYGIFVLQRPDGALVPLLFQLLRSPSFFCRVEAFEAVCALRSPRLVLRALQIVDKVNDTQNGHVLTEDLGTYPGDRQKLNELLWANYTDLSPATQLSVLNYFRFTTGSMGEEFLSLLTDPAVDCERCFCAIRYFGRYPDSRAYPYLLDYADESRHAKWEYSAIASTALGSYPGEETQERLVKNLSSRNWYTRFNAASSLARLRVDLPRLLENMDTREKYGREILQYQMDRMGLLPAGKEAARS